MSLMTRNSVQLLLQRFVYTVTARMWDFVAYALSFLALQEDAPMDVDHEGPASVTNVQYASICPECQLLVDVKFMGAETIPHNRATGAFCQCNAAHASMANAGRVI